MRPLLDRLRPTRKRSAPPGGTTAAGMTRSVPPSARRMACAPWPARFRTVAARLSCIVIFAACARSAAAADAPARELCLRGHQLLLVTAVMVAQAGVIVALVAQNRRRRRAEDALAAGEERFRALLEYGYEGTAIVTPQGRVAYASPGTGRMFGRSEAQILERAAVADVHPDDRPAVEGALSAVQSRPGEMQSLLCRVRHENGEYRWIEATVRNLIDHPAVGGIVANYRDVTDRRAVREELDRSRRFAERIAAATPDIIYVLDLRDRRLVHVTSEVTDTLGYVPDELCAAGLSAGRSLVHADDLPSVVDSFARLGRAADGELVTREFRLRHKDGSWRWLRARETPFSRDADGAVRQVVGAAEDVTERKAIEHALRRSEARLRQIIDLVPHFIFAKDRDGRFILVNRAVAEAYGGAVADITGRTDADFNRSPEEVRQFREDDLDVIRSGRPKVIPLERITDAQGAVRWLHTIKIPFTEADSDLPSVLGVAMDVTERRRADQALRESELKYRTLIDTTDTGFCVVDSEGRILDANENYVRLTGRASLGDVLGHTVLEWTAPYDIERNAEEVRRCAASGRVRQLEVDYIAPDGRVVPIEINATAIQHADGLRILALCRDITERRSAADALRRAHAELEDRVRQRTAQLETANAALQAEIAERARAEAALRESKYLLDLALRASNVGIWSWNLNSDEVFYSPTWKSQLGYDDHEVGSGYEEWEGRLHPDDLARVTEHARQFIALERPDYDLEFRLRHKDGAYRWIHTRAELVLGADGRPERITGCHIDVTARKQAEAALREAERFARAIVDALTSHIAILDESGEILAVNRAWTDFACGHDGDPRRVGVGANYLAVCDQARDAISGRAAAEFAQGIRDVIAGRLDSHEQEYECHDGAEQRWFVGRVTRFPGEGPVRIVVSHEDITRRRLSERVIRRQAQILEQIHDAVIVLDTEGRITDWNVGAERTFGYSADQARGRHVSFLYFPEDHTADVRERVAMLRSAGRCEAEERRRARSGDELFVHSSMSLLRDEAGEITGMIEYAIDITARRRAEERVRRYQEELSHVDRLMLMGQMASALAHEINQPLSAIANYTTGCLRRLRRAGLDANELIDPLRRASEQAQRAGEVIRRLREFTRKREPQLSLVAVPDLVGEVVRFAEFHAAHAGVRVALDLPGDLPAVLVDRIQIGQVLLNLIHNGIDAMRGTPPKRRLLSIRARAAGSASVELAVRDSGPGLSQETLEHLFEPFMTTKPDGMGIGLSISRTIVEAHGGSLTPVASPDAGAEFVIRLPVYSPAARSHNLSVSN